MATPADITLLIPYISIEAATDGGNIDVFRGDEQGQLGVVRAIYSGCTRVAVDDVVLFRKDRSVFINQPTSDGSQKFFQVDEMDIIFKSTYVPVDI